MVVVVSWLLSLSWWCWWGVVDGGATFVTIVVVVVPCHCCGGGCLHVATAAATVGWAVCVGTVIINHSAIR